MRPKWFASIVILLLLPACSRQESGWHEAESRDSVAAYQQYLERFPAGAHADAARARIAALQEQEEWDRASRLRTPEAWQRYLAAWPEGRHAATARKQLAEFVPTDDASAGRGFSLQLGAYSSEAAAEADHERLAGDYSVLLGDLSWKVLQPETAAPGLWRLRAGPVDETGARKLCEMLKATGTDCMPVAN